MKSHVRGPGGFPVWLGPMGNGDMGPPPPDRMIMSSVVSVHQLSLLSLFLGKRHASIFSHLFK